MEMQQIRHFVAVVQHGNIRRAADALNITQPALTRSIKNLEQNLEVELLARSSRGVTPTMFGEIFFEYAQRALNESRRVVEQLSQLRGGTGGELRLGLSASYSDPALSNTLAQFMRSRPELTVSLTEAFFGKLVEQLVSGDLDAIIALCPQGFSHPDLAIEELGAKDAQIYCRAGHPLARRGRKTTLAELREASWAALELSEMDRFFERALAAVIGPRPVVKLRTNAGWFLKEMVASSDMLALSQRTAMANEVKAGRCVELSTELGTVTAPVAVMYKDRIGLPRMLEDFLKLLRRTRTKPAARR